MENKKTYVIKGYHINDEGLKVEDTFYHYNGKSSLIDHSKSWLNESQKIGYLDGDIDITETIKANYNKILTSEQFELICESDELLDTPLDILFNNDITDFITNKINDDYEIIMNTCRIKNSNGESSMDEVQKLRELKMQKAELNKY